MTAQPCAAPAAGAEAEVVTLLDTLATAQLRLTISEFEDLLARLRRAMTVRHRLAGSLAATRRAARATGGDEAR